MKIPNAAGQNRHISSRLITWVFIVSLGAASWTEGAGGDIALLRKQKTTAEEAEDKPAVVELSRRIVAIDPNDSDSWEDIVQGQVVAEDYDRAAETLKAWRKAVKTPPAAIEDLEGDLAIKRKDPAAAERHYLAYLTRKPAKDDTAAMYEKLADLCVDQQRFKDAEGFMSKSIAAEDSPSRRVYHATGLLRLHRWDAAYAEMDKAKKKDSTDAQVKEWLPQFELLAEFLPRIKTIEVELAKKPNDADLLLDRAHLFALANRPLLALDDCKRAMEIDPASMRARIQAGEALLDLSRDEEAAKLQVGRNLARDPKKHVPEGALRAIGEKDKAIRQDPNSAQFLADRAEILRDLNQFVLSLGDAQAALAIDDDLLAAHFEAAENFQALGQSKEALPHAIRATELAQNNWIVWYGRGLIEGERADYPAAIESQTHSINIKESIKALREREKCQRRIGQNDKADADRRRLHELDPDHE